MQEVKRRVKNCFVALHAAGAIAGCYTFAAASLPLTELSADEKQRALIMDAADARRARKSTPRTTRPSPSISATNFGVSLASQRRCSCRSRQHCKHCLPNAPSKRSLENSQSRLHDQSEREQRFEPGSYFVKHACGSLAYKPRPSLLPRGTAQLIGLYNAVDLVAVWYRDLKAPITITPRDGAGDAPTRQFIKGLRGKHKRRAPPGLLVGDRL
jgi:hypothetical protein